MSGYDPRTGWVHFTPTKWRRYWRPIEGASSAIEDCLEDAGLDYYWDASGGLHAHCTEGRLWEVLSGQPDGRPTVDEPGSGTEWVSVTDVGANFDPPKAATSVLALLRRTGLLERVDGRDVPTAAAAGLYEEREAVPAGGFETKPGTIQRRWAYEVLRRLVDAAPVPADTTAKPAPKPAKTRPPKEMALRYPGTCADCGAALAAGQVANYHPDTRTVSCLQHEP